MKRFFWAWLALGMITTMAIFGLPGQSAKKSQYPMEPVFIEAGPKELASSRDSMISSSHPFATKAGLEMLRRGGNAVDAAVAATLVMGVTEGNTSLAGGGVLTYYDAKTGKTTVINFEPNGFKEEVMPYNQASDALTGRSIKVPGSFAGLHYAIEKYGRLLWKDVMEPAIFYAENGYPLHGRAYSTMRTYYATLTLRQSGQKIFAPNGFLPAVGSVFKQPEMAETLKKIADQGPSYFYQGPFAEEMVKAIQEIGGKASLEDFSSYKVIELEPVTATYQDFQIKTHPAPSDMVAAIEAMNILENVDLKAMGHYTESADSLQWMIETLQVVAADFQKFNGVPEYDTAVGKVLMSKEYAKSRHLRLKYKIEQLNREAAKKTLEPSAPFGGQLINEEAERGTQHTSVVDKEGNICGLKHTIYGSTYSYAGLFVGGLVLNASGGFHSFPGERILPATSPPIVFKGDRPYFTCDSSGLYENAFFLISNILIWDKNFKEAQEAPRFNFNNDKIRIEHRLSDQLVGELKRRGYQFEWLGPYTLGTAQLVGFDLVTGARLGAADPRSHGLAAGF